MILIIQITIPFITGQIYTLLFKWKQHITLFCIISHFFTIKTFASII
jgi:hypothetical protein